MISFFGRTKDQNLKRRSFKVMLNKKAFAFAKAFKILFKNDL